MGVQRQCLGRGEGVVGQQERVAVRRRTGGRLRADAARAAADILDHHGLAQLSAERRLDGARERIDTAAGWPWHDETQRARRKGFLSLRHARERGCGRRCRHKRRKPASADIHHGLTRSPKSTRGRGATRSAHRHAAAPICVGVAASKEMSGRATNQRF